MDRFFMLILILALGVVVVALARNMRRAAGDRGAVRAAYLNECKGLLATPRTRIGPTGFPRVAGSYEDVEADIQVLPDTLTFRKLPALWVMVSLPAPLPLSATVDLMIRPTGVEHFSRFNTLHHQIDLPPGFPEDCAIRTDDPANLPDEALIRRHLHLFDDPMVKELILSPKGLRIVFLAEEAKRSRYLVYRDNEMGQEPLNPALVQARLDQLIALRSDIWTGATDQPMRKSA